jgi:hypothetical protein
VDEVLELFFGAGMLAIVALCAASFFLVKFLNRGTDENAPVKAAALVFLIAVLTFPTGERWLFGRAVEKAMSENPFVVKKRVVYWGAIGEPITWFRSFPGSVVLASPTPFEYRFDSPVNGFNEVHYRFQEKPVHRLVDVYCADALIWVSEPDETGVFKYKTRQAERMDDEDQRFFCRRDFTEEAKLVNEYALRQSQSSPSGRVK